MSLFSSLTEPRYPNAALGIEADRVVAVALSGGRRQYTIRQAATVELRSGVIVPGFSEQNVIDEREFASSLRETVEAAGLLGQKRWSVTLPSGSARTAIIAVDSEPSSRGEAEEVLDWKAEQTFGVPAAEMRLSRQRVSADREGRPRYFTAAVKLSVVDEYERSFEALGWKVGLVLPRAVGEANWLIDRAGEKDSLLISGSDDGFTALVLRGTEPAVVRSVTCSAGEIDDEVYRLVMYYNDRFGSASLERLLVVGRDLQPKRIEAIASEALGTGIHAMSGEDLGLALPGTSFSFDDIAAPAGLAALGA